jgi:uncharacterized protein YbbC (DUF1343 family)
MKTGLDVLAGEGFRRLKGRRVGLLVHPASVDAGLGHAVRLFRSSKNVRLVRLFGPQHGIRGETQDNMIEWEGFRDPATGLRVFSLYGRRRKPAPEMLRGLDVLVIDLQDVGARPYTFNWTALLCMKACAEQGVRVMVLDRPNPVSPSGRDGPVLDMVFNSFVGLAAVPLQHAMTAGELAALCNAELGLGADLEVVRMKGWRRSMWFEDTGLPWVLPSPNLPTPESALVYPGFVLLEGTNLSEGRGTTRPFEFFGAPFIEPDRLVRRLDAWRLPGVFFRPLGFKPTFQKWAGKLCAGAQVHVTDRAKFRPVLTAAAVLCAARELWPKEFAWKRPPYEYERVKLPIDILAGDERLRRAVDSGVSPLEISRSWRAELSDFARRAEPFLHYD